MERRHFLASAGIIAGGYISNIPLLAPTLKIPSSLDPVMVKFKSELESSFLGDTNLICQLTSVKTILAQEINIDHSYVFYESKGGDRIVLMNKGEKEQIIVNPSNPERYFTRLRPLT